MPVITNDPSAGTVTKDRTPLEQIIDPSNVKRLQDAGYRISHVADVPAAEGGNKEKSARGAKKRAKSAKKSAKKSAAKKKSAGSAKSAAKAVDKLRSRMKKR
jgi:hypothetical protein